MRQGASLDFGVISDHIYSITIVDSRGKPVEYDVEHPHFNQARLSFGMLGVVTEMVLKLESLSVYPDKPFRKSLAAKPTTCRTVTYR